MIRVAAIDCGTNSLRLLVADGVSAQGAAEIGEVSRRMEIVRMGSGVDRTGVLAASALRRVDAALTEFAAELALLRPDRVRMVATSALRDVTNAAAFVDIVRQRLGRLGVVPEIISGQDEAALAFRGATLGLSAARYPCPRVVIDIGGGSTELVWGSGDGAPRVVSMDVGAVRLTERWFRGDPPTTEEVAAARADIAAALAGVDAPRGSGLGTVIGVAGSVVTVAAIARKLTSYRPELLHHHRLDAAAVSRISGELLNSSRAQREVDPAIHPGRVDVIGAGALILDEVMRWLGASELLVSECDILHGIVDEMLAARHD